MSVFMQTSIYVCAYTYKIHAYIHMYEWKYVYMYVGRHEWA